VHWTAGIALCRAAGAVVTNLAGDDLHTATTVWSQRTPRRTPSYSTDCT
jgi:fructose-1,6-bisphosphatase/inositol monophosphatase family enzyme